MTKDQDINKLSYQQAIDELKTLIDELDDGSVDVDTLGSRFERAILLVEELEGRLLKTKDQLEKLTPRLEDAVSTAQRQNSGDQG